MLAKVFMSSKFQMSQLKLAIIPARSGSQRVKNKNIRKINGRSLIERAIDSVLDKKIKIIFTSDSDDYVNFVSTVYQDKVISTLRPKYLAENTTKVVDEVERILKLEELKLNDCFTLLLPTSPFRTNTLFSNMLAFSIENNRGCFSCKEYEFPVSFAHTIDENGDWTPMLGEQNPMLSGNTRSQNQKKFYHPTGGVYIQKVGDFFKNKSLYENSSPFLVNSLEGLDIDTEQDWLIASLISKELDI